MNLNIKVKPVLYKGRSKDEIQKMVRGYGLSVGDCGTYVSSDDSINAIVINYHKVNRKTKRIKTDNGYTVEVVRTAHWVGYVYRFNLEILRAANLKVIQKSGNFEIVNR